MSTVHPTPRGAPGRRFSLMSIIAAVAVLFAVAFGVLWLIELFDDEPSEGLVIGITLGDVTDDPGAFTGEFVRVSGSVNEVLSPQVFRLGDDGLLVASADVPAELSEGDVFQVEGIVREFDAADIEEELGITFEPDTLDEIDNDSHVIVASAVRSDLEVPPGAAGQLPDGALSVETIVENMDEYEGQDVVLVGEATRALSEHVLILNGLPFGTNDLLVVTPEFAPGVFVDFVPVRVEGTVEELDIAEAEAFVGVELDNLIEDYEGEPVIYAESMIFYPSDRDLIDPAFGLIGFPVVVRSEVEEVFSDRVFAFDGVLVVTQEPVDAVASASALVEGTVGLLDTVTVDEEELELPEDFPLDDWEGRPVIMAESVTIVR